MAARSSMENCEGDGCGLHDESNEKAQEAENNKQLENTSCSAPSDQSGSSFCLNLSDIRQYFPKTANYKVNDSNHSSPWCAVPERWAHARSFLRDKLNYWVQTLKSVKFSDEKDEQIAMRVIHQLAWLLKNSWDGRRESECPSETLWRARRKENRLDEKLLQNKIAAMQMEGRTSSGVSKLQNGHRSNEGNNQPRSSSSSSHQTEQPGQQHSPIRKTNNAKQLTQLSMNNGVLFQLVILQRQWKRISNKMDEFSQEIDDRSHEIVDDYVQNLGKKINEFANMQYALNNMTCMKTIMRESHALEQRLKRSRYAAIMADRVLFSRVFAQSLVTKPTKKKKKKKKRYVSAVNSVRSRENATLGCSQESSGHSASMSFTHHNPSNSSVSAIQNCNSTNTTSVELSKQQRSSTESSSITPLRSNVQQSSSSSLAQSSADNESNADNVNQIHDRTSDELSVTSSSTTPLTTTPSDKHSSSAHSCDDATENDLDLSLYGRGKRVSKPKRIDDLDEMEAINVVKKTVRKRGRPPKNGICYMDKPEKQKCEENGYLNVTESGKKFDGNNQSNIPFKKRKFRTDSSAEIAVNAEKCVEKKKRLIDDSDKGCDEQNKCEIVEEDNRMPSTSDQQSVPASLNMEENQTNEDCSDSDDDLLDLDDLSDIEDRWLNFCLEDERAKEKQFAELIEPLINWCNSYRDIVGKAMPKSVAKTRCADRKKKIQKYSNALESLLNNSDSGEQLRNKSPSIANEPSDDDDAEEHRIEVAN